MKRTFNYTLVIVGLILAAWIGCRATRAETTIPPIKPFKQASVALIQDTVEPQRLPSPRIIPAVVLPNEIKAEDYNNIDSLRKLSYAQGNTIIFLIRRNSYVRDSLAAMIQRLQDTLNSGVNQSRSYYANQVKLQDKQKLADATNKVMDSTINYTFIFIAIVVTVHFLAYLWITYRNKQALS